MDSYGIESQFSNSAVPDPMEPPPSYSYVYNSDKYSGKGPIPHVNPTTEHVLFLSSMGLTEVPPHCSSILLRTIQYRRKLCCSRKPRRQSTELGVIPRLRRSTLFKLSSTLGGIYKEDSHWPHRDPSVTTMVCPGV